MDSKETIYCFCKNVAHLRKQYGYTQKEMACIMGIGVNSLRKLEKGILARNITARTLHNLCSYFHISADVLLSEQIEDYSSST